MTIYGVIFYVLAAMIVAATVLAVTRRDPIHAVIYLVVSFLGSAMLFYLLGAPFLAAVQVIIYAGAIMVLFLFVVMMLRPNPEGKRAISQWVPAVFLGLVFLVLATLVATMDTAALSPLKTAVAAPTEFGRFIFERYWLAVEIVSLLLFLALVAAIQFGRESRRSGVRGQRSEVGENKEPKAAYGRNPIRVQGSEVNLERGTLNGEQAVTTQKHISANCREVSLKGPKANKERP